MSNTLLISGDYYISTSGKYIGVNSNFHVMVDDALKTKFTIKPDSSSNTHTITCMIKSKIMFAVLDAASPPQVIVDDKTQNKWVFNLVSGDTYIISPAGDADHGWCEPDKAPLWIYIEKLDPKKPHWEFKLTKAN